MAAPVGRSMSQGLRLAIDIGPVVVFFGVNWLAGLMPATAALMAATVAAVVVGWMIERRVPMMPAVTCGLVLVFGGLTLWLADETFIKMKPTIAKLLFAAAIAASLVLRRNLLMAFLGGRLHLTETGWTRLAYGWMLIAVACAAANEAVWRTVSTDTWVSFKLALVPVSIIGYVAVTHLLARRHWDVEAERKAAEAPP